MIETISGVPLGLSRDYDQLPLVEPARLVRCMPCGRKHADGRRRDADGCLVMAVMCRECRERGRERWIAEHVVELPRAVAVYRSRRGVS